VPMPNLHFFDPMKLALEDFDMNDISYSKIGKSDAIKLDKNIVIINIGHADREGLAYLIDKTAEMEPKVMGLDAFFEGEREPQKDSLLKETFEKNKNLIVISRINLHKWEEEDELEFLEDHFDEAYSKRGFANLIGEQRGTVREFSPMEKNKGETYLSFAAALVKEYDSTAFKKLEKRHKHVETISYTRPVSKYQVIEGEDLLNGNVDKAAIKGKIALLGYIDNNPDDIEDKIFTPMNNKFAGKSIPDMNGIVVHANIISMILEHNYIKKLPSWINLVIAVLIGWLHMSFFIRYYLEDHIWFHLVAKFAQLVSAIFFVYIGMYLYAQYNIKLDMSLTLIVIILSVDIIYFYEAFAVWMHKKFHFHTVFHQKHH
jgi:CHASE2 domain-containing sensor protein